MTILCANGTHVTLTGSLRCTCGQAANGYPVAGLSGGIFRGYNPYGLPRPPTPPTLRPGSGQAAGEAPPLNVFEAAQRAGASHLSADGRRIYCQRLGAVLQAEWDGNGWGSWWSCEGLPPDAVAM